MMFRVRAWIKAHPRWSAAILALIAAPSIAYGVLVWKTNLRPDRLASIGYLVRQFDQVIFQSEWKSEWPVVKWTDPVRIKIVGDDADRWRPVIEYHMAEFSALGGAGIFPKYLQPETFENVFIYFVEQSEFEKIIIRHINFPGELLENLGDNQCFLESALPNSSLDDAILIISTEKGDNYISACIFKGLTRLLGFHYISELIRPSVFSRWDWHLRDLSINDRILVRTLYDRRMRVGMHRRKALEAARLIITELVAEAKASEAAPGG